MTIFALIRQMTLIAISLTVILGASNLMAAEDYRLGAGDIVRVTVFGHDDLTTEARVSESGVITFPLLGKLSVDGLSTEQVQSLITERLRSGDFIKNPQVSVIVNQFTSRQVTVIGSVSKPGKYSLDKVSMISDVLATAGGIDQTGGDTVILIRPGINGGTEIRTEIDLKGMFLQSESKNIEVIDGDTIYVPPAKVFYIYGQVQRPGMYRLERNMTVVQAISVGGGITPKGTENGITLKRSDEHGAMQTYPVELTEKLLPDDVLYVPESWF